MGGETQPRGAPLGVNPATADNRAPGRLVALGAITKMAASQAPPRMAPTSARDYPLSLAKATTQILASTANRDRMRYAPTRDKRAIRDVRRIELDATLGILHRLLAAPTGSELKMGRCWPAEKVGGGEGKVRGAPLGAPKIGHAPERKLGHDLEHVGRKTGPVPRVEA